MNAFNKKICLFTFCYIFRFELFNFIKNIVMYAFRNSGLTKEQLTNLGVTGKDVPNAAPTMLFPPLISRPMEIEKNNNALDYKVMWKEEFRIHLYDVHSKSELNLTDDSYSSKVAVSLSYLFNLKS